MLILVACTSCCCLKRLHSCCDFVDGGCRRILQLRIANLLCLCYATGGVDLDMGTDQEFDPASQLMSRATSGDMVGQDEDMQSGLLASWVIV